MRAGFTVCDWVNRCVWVWLHCGSTYVLTTLRTFHKQSDMPDNKSNLLRSNAGIKFLSLTCTISQSQQDQHIRRRNPAIANTNTGSSSTTRHDLLAKAELFEVSQTLATYEQGDIEYPSNPVRVIGHWSSIAVDDLDRESCSSRGLGEVWRGRFLVCFGRFGFTWVLDWNALVG